MKPAQIFPRLLIFLLLTACSLPMTPTALPPSATPAPTAVPALTAQQALNATYTLASNDGGQMQYTLQDGGFQNGSDPALPGYAAVFTLRDKIALGDLNGDGAGDALVPVGLNFGGTGQFVFLAALLNRDGSPVHAAPATYGLGDRPQVESLAIENGKIHLTAIISGPNDPACCGTVPLEMTLEYNEMGFRVLRVSTGAANGVLRQITISSPAPEASVGQQVVIRGGTSIGPFENTLVYRIYGADGAAVSEAAFSVQNAEIGQPATFELPLDFAALGVSGRIRVEIAEMSAADGSTLMLDSLYLNVEK
ncbi:MAG: hypothetical protein OHK0031_08240 [Anaerolineales bacterium]